MRRDIIKVFHLTMLSMIMLGVADGCREDSSPTERSGIIQRKGIPMTLLGPELKVGQKAPPFTVVDAESETRTLSEFTDKIVIISTVPSLDTPMCNLQTKRLNEEAQKLAPDVVILTMSLDLPFAMKRWSDEARAHNTIMLSDYRDRNFGRAYGLIIKERMLLARAVMIIDQQGTIQYFQLVKEQYSQPDYDALLAALQKLQEKK